MMNNFKTEDITHHSKRTQAGNIEKAGTAYDLCVDNSSSIRVDTSSKVTTVSEVPKSVTLESAIKFYREHATGRMYSLFKMTAEWLDKYRTASRTAMNKLIEEAKEKEKEAVTVDMSEMEE